MSIRAQVLFTLAVVGNVIGWWVFKDFASTVVIFLAIFALLAIGVLGKEGDG